MKIINPAHIIDQLDLTAPEDLLIAFHHLQHWPAIKPFPEPQAAIEQLETIQHYAPMIFGQPDDIHTAATIEHFMLDLGGFKYNPASGGTEPLAPREWLAGWREASNRGLIGPITFGSAYRFFMVRTAGNGAPGLSAHSIEARRLMLDDALRADPAGLMDCDERRVLAALPEKITLYRGGRGDFGETMFQRSQGLHWALHHEYAATYLRGRGHQRTMVAMRDTLRDITAWAAGIGTARAELKDVLGQPYLLRATMPKGLAIAYVAAGVQRDQVELLVDFDKITPDMIEDVTPAGYRWAA